MKSTLKFFAFLSLSPVAHGCVAPRDLVSLIQFPSLPTLRILRSVLYPVFKLRCAKFIVILEQDDGQPSMA